MRCLTSFLMVRLRCAPGILLETCREAYPGADKDKKADTSNNTMGALSTMAYIESLGANPLNYEVFVVLDIVQAQGVGKITRSGFVDGWTRLAADQKVAPQMQAHQQHVRSCISRVTTDPAYFKTLYQAAFRIGKEPQQKALDMGFAIAFWGMLFEPTMRSWQTAHVNWLEAWTEYLTGRFFVKGDDDAGDEEEEEDEGNEKKQKDKWTRTVSKDLWTQTALFAAKTLGDETLSFWSEEQAWPGLIDEFVVWCRDKRIVATKNTEHMEIDE